MGIGKTTNRGMVDGIGAGNEVQTFSRNACRFHSIRKEDGK